jgi:hypothetical protein
MIDNETVDVLCWVNDIRTAQGLPRLLDLPQGVTGHCYNCPIAKATHAAIQKEFYEVEGDGPHMMPEKVIRWIAKFDEGGYPEYTDMDAEDYYE